MENGNVDIKYYIYGWVDLMYYNINPLDVEVHYGHVLEGVKVANVW